MLSARIVISGCSGGGKSTLLAALANRGHMTVPEPGRRIVRRQEDPESAILPWNDPLTFAKAAADLAMADYDVLRDTPGLVFFDRGVIDALCAVAHVTGEPFKPTLAARYAYSDPVFLAPPWPEIYGTDQERRHDFNAASAEFDRLLACYTGLGKEIFVLPKTAIHHRVAFVLARVKAI